MYEIIVPRYELFKHGINGEPAEVCLKTENWQSLLSFINKSQDINNLYIKFNALKIRDMKVEEVYDIMQYCEREHLCHVTLKNLAQYIRAKKHES